ncbi:MAG: flavoprotein, partial [Phycisphaerae bacterium]
MKDSTANQPSTISDVKTSAMPDLSRHRIVVCVCGGIAAYKTATLVSRLVQSGADVHVAMTQNAQRFIGALTFLALTGRQVFTDAWSAEGNTDIHHLSLSEKSDLIVVA